MKVYENGVSREMTPEELEEWESQPTIEILPTDTERIDVLETAIRKGMML